MRKIIPKSPIYFIFIIGLVSLFSDMSYEGARSIVGPYLGYLGAGSTVVGIVAGLGEFLGYGLRIFAGWLADRLRKYWELVFSGYFLSLFAVPLLAFVDHWIPALGLLILERVGKALRTPARDAILSVATKRIGRGLGFGIHEALDQIGAVLGPLIVAGVLFLKNSYYYAFLVLIVPGILALLALFVARNLLENSVEGIRMTSKVVSGRGFSKAFWMYLFGLCLLGAGFVSFALAGYHFDRIQLFPKELIPALYALAMAVDAIFALIFGYLYDKVGYRVVLISIAFSLVSTPLLFSGNHVLVILGVIFWGIGLGAQESILRAVVADLVPREKRASGYGVFHSLFGLAMLGGGFILGALYQYSLASMIAFSVTLQLLSFLVLLRVGYSIRAEKH